MIFQKVHWFTKDTRYSTVYLHLGIRVFIWTFEINKRQYTTNIQDGATRPGWPI